MKTLSLLAASVALLSSLAVAAPVDAKREELYSENTLRAFEKKDNTFLDEKREGDIYTRETLSITGEEKREELYAAPQNLYSKLSLAAKEKQ
ncbi:hypothetical protein VSDG_09457 [Cytospora chrysosperma]|uniref:Uncharacterized protein n=1 Tax=Cytospora chrysosperma TaxID=252740 RepID=A0A423VAU4_CYTCH|nr:hypothetical protein VSDG_09457 [Valsa sordida]